MKNISKEKYRNALLEILADTLPNLNSLSGQCILSEYERKTLITLAWDMDNNDRDGIEDILYAQYQKFRKSETLSCFFPEYYMSLAYCLGRLARLRQNFKEAEDILEDALKQIHFLQDDFRLDCLCIQRYLLELDKQKAQGLSLAHKSYNHTHWIRYAYAINKLYRLDSTMTKYIKKQLDKPYNKLPFPISIPE